MLYLLGWDLPTRTSPHHPRSLGLPEANHEEVKHQVSNASIFYLWAYRCERYTNDDAGHPTIQYLLPDSELVSFVDSHVGLWLLYLRDRRPLPLLMMG